MTDICVTCFILHDTLSISFNAILISLFWNGQFPLFVTIKRQVTQLLLTCLLCLHNDIMRLIHVTSTLAVPF